jgi:hypothetical protein
MAQTIPMAPKTTNARRQDISENTHTTSNGVNAPPQRALNHITPTARLRSSRGSQFVNILARFGKQPASPAPKRKRVTSNDPRFHAQPVAAVNRDHQTTTRMSTLRGPMVSPSQPPGISNNAYAQANAANAQPICTFVRPRSRWMSPAACEMQTRSM